MLTALVIITANLLLNVDSFIEFPIIYLFIIGTEEDTFNALRRIPAEQVFQRYLTWRNSKNIFILTDEEKDAYIVSLGWTWVELQYAFSTKPIKYS